MLNKSRGFTLIELLVVIAIIGVLSVVVLAVLNSARVKGIDAKIKSNLGSSRSQAELFYSTTGNGTYTNVCLAGTNSISLLVGGVQNSGSADVDCNDDSDEWALSAQSRVNTALYYCVDYKGKATTTTAAIVAGIASDTNGDIDCD